jgi:hypothetical protein
VPVSVSGGRGNERTKTKRRESPGSSDHLIVLVVVIVLGLLMGKMILGLLLKEAVDDNDNEKRDTRALPLLARGIAPAGTKRFRASTFGIKFLADHAADVVRQ